jgi:hypothetical protein
MLQVLPQVTPLTQASDGGAFIDVTDDSKEKLDAAFAQVAQLISQDVAMEDF